jgi:hypothetical protein
VKDWTGSRIREDALKLVCRDCHAAIGEPCTQADGTVIQAFPAHAKRLSDAAKVAEAS